MDPVTFKSNSRVFGKWTSCFIYFCSLQLLKFTNSSKSTQLFKMRSLHFLPLHIFNCYIYMQEDKLLPKVDNCKTTLKVNLYSDFPSVLPCLSDLVLSLVLELAMELWCQTRTADVCLSAKKTGLYNRKRKKSYVWLFDVFRVLCYIISSSQFFKKSEGVLDLNYLNKVEEWNSKLEV